MKTYIKYFGIVLFAMITVFASFEIIAVTNVHAQTQITSGLEQLKTQTQFAESRDVLGGARAKKYDVNGRVVRVTNFKSGEEIVSAFIYRAVTLTKNLLAFIAVAIIIYSGIMIVIADDSEATFKKEKSNIIYSVAGLVVVLMAEPFVSRLFRSNPTGATNYDQAAPTFLDNATKNINVFILELINTSMQILTVIAVLIIVILGAQMMFTDDEGKQKKFRVQIVYVVMGLVFVMLAPSIISVFYGEIKGGQVVSYGIDVKRMVMLVSSIIKNLMSMAAIVSFAMLVYAGFKLFFGGLEEGGIKKARSIIINSVLGLILILMAYVIVDFAVGKLGAVAI